MCVKITMHCLLYSKLKQCKVLRERNFRDFIALKEWLKMHLFSLCNWSCDSRPLHLWVCVKSSRCMTRSWHKGAHLMERASFFLAHINVIFPYRNSIRSTRRRCSKQLVSKQKHKTPNVGTCVCWETRLSARTHTQTQDHLMGNLSQHGSFVPLVALDGELRGSSNSSSSKNYYKRPNQKNASNRRRRISI